MKILPAAAISTAVGATLQAILGIMLALGNPSVGKIHSIVGIVTLLLAILTAVMALVDRRMQLPAIILAVLGLAQYALGEMHLEYIHMVVGVIFLGLSHFLAAKVGKRRAE